MPEIGRVQPSPSRVLAPVVASLQAGSSLGARGNRGASAKLFRDERFVVLGRAGAERSHRIIAQIRYQVNNYLLDMYSNARAVLGKGRGELRPCSKLTSQISA